MQGRAGIDLIHLGVDWMVKKIFCTSTEKESNLQAT